jgi:predicted metalloenzyme YecM
MLNKDMKNLKTYYPNHLTENLRMLLAKRHNFQQCSMMVNTYPCANWRVYQENHGRIKSKNKINRREACGIRTPTDSIISKR